MTDRSLTPEIYGDFGLFLDQMGVRQKREPEKPKNQQPHTKPEEDPNGWYKRGEECPF